MRAKYSFQTKAYLLVFLIVIGLISCRDSENEKRTQEKPQNGDSLSALNPKIEYLLPSPDEIINIIFKEKIDYKPELTLKPSKETKIINSDFQALILGVYITDFSYSLIYNDLSKSSKCLNVIKNLSDNLGIGGLFNERYFARIEGNINNIDSLKSIYSDFSMNSFETLSSFNSDELLSLIAIGASLESIYLGYNIFKAVSSDNSLKPFFVEQRMVFENFYQNYNSYNCNKKDLKKFNDDVCSFYTLFKSNIWLIVDKNKLSKSDSIMSIDVKYIVKTRSDNFNELGRSICDIRGKLVNLNYQ